MSGLFGDGLFGGGLFDGSQLGPGGAGGSGGGQAPNALPEVRTLLLRPGRNPLDLTKYATAKKWASTAVGGFADCSFELGGDWQQQVPKLSLVRIAVGPDVLFEGQVEDTGLAITDGEVKTKVSAFGLRRRLEQTSVKRIWVKRDINWANTTFVSKNTAVYPGSGLTVNSVSTNVQANDVTIGQLDVSDLTKIGVRFAVVQTEGAFEAQAFKGADFILQDTVMSALLCTMTLTGSDWGANKLLPIIGSSSDGATWTAATQGNATADLSVTLAPSANRIRIGFYNSLAGGFTPTTDDKCDYTNLRLLGATTTEDTTGGLYGGTILRDLLALVPDLTIGIIENGEDFTIDQMDRTVRDSALSVMEEVNSYYPTREWGVWEDGRTDWRTRNLDEPQWLTNVSRLASLDITSSVDNIIRTVYLSYIDAVTFESHELNATSTDQRNPFVKRGQTKDAAINVPFLMTSNTAQRLATVLGRLQGAYPPVTGSAAIPISTMLGRANGPPMPAAMIRGGDNIAISGLPKSDPLQQGRDGETLFHIVSVQTSEDEGLVTIELEGQDRRSDALMARLSSASRSVTG